jgi:DMSO/TMAO reductase YedYZ molybdopterin-dependent catalytic subunit
MLKAASLIRLIIAFSIIVFPIYIFTGCDSTIELTGTEIREYEGENLSSINDFLENSINGPQFIDIETYSLKISGLVENPVEYSYDELIDSNQHYKKVITLYCVQGWEVTILWEGLLVSDLLAEAGVLPEAQVIIFHAYDGYTTSLPLDYIIDNDILLAHKMNGLILPPERGFPFELAAESRWGYKWIKWVTEIELSCDTEYEGFWESRGYSNSADLGEPFFD